MWLSDYFGPGCKISTPFECLVCRWGVQWNSFLDCIRYQYISNTVKFFGVCYLKERNNLEYVGIGDRIKFKYLIKKQGGRVCT